MKSGIASIIASVILLSGLSGCALEPLAEPAGGDRARLRVISQEDVVGYPNRDCIDYNAPGRGRLIGAWSIGKDLPDKKPISMPAATSRVYAKMGEYYIEAGKPFSLTFEEKRRSRYQCQMALTMSFIPVVNKDYEAQLVIDYSAKTCALSLKMFNESLKVWESIRFTQPERCKK